MAGEDSPLKMERVFVSFNYSRNFGRPNREVPTPPDLELCDRFRSALVDDTAVYQWHPG